MEVCSQSVFLLKEEEKKISYLDLVWLCYEVAWLMLVYSQGKQISQWNPFILTLRNVLSVTSQWWSLFCVLCRNYFLMGSNLMPFGLLSPNRYISVSGPLTLHRENIQYSFIFFLFKALQSLLDNSAVWIDIITTWLNGSASTNLGFTSVPVLMFATVYTTVINKAHLECTRINYDKFPAWG